MSRVILTAVLAALLLAGALGAAARVGAPAHPVIVGAGDIASCDGAGDEATARLLDAIPGTVYTTGDNAYERGTDQTYAECYGPSWGRHKARTRPSLGNHDYGPQRAAPYFRYFGAAAGAAPGGYYSYTVGTWLLIALNSNCWAVGGCGPDSPQVAWLREVLAANPAVCALAYWHHPRFSSGPHGSSTEMRTLWQTLYDARADVVLVGHDHFYERFAPQDPDGRPMPDRGLRQITVGTGGRSHYPVRRVVANSEVRHSGTFGVLRLVLGPGAYTWDFIPEAGTAFRDGGAGTCVP